MLYCSLLTDGVTPNRYKRLEEYSGIRGWVEQLTQKGPPKKEKRHKTVLTEHLVKKNCIIILKLSKSEAFFLLLQT